MQVLQRGATGDAARALQAATNRRLHRRGLSYMAIEEDGVAGAKTMAAVTAAAWALGARRETIARIDRGEIPIGVQRMIRNPGRRSDEQKALGRKRVAHMVAARRQHAAAAAEAGPARGRVVEVAQRAAANYRAKPDAYHYSASGRANAVCLEPTPRDWRSDCSQFVAAVYKAAGLPSPATVSHEAAATSSIDAQGRVTTRPRPGDLGMYGVHGGVTHHVELYCGLPGQEFIGHGIAPIDSATPGRPDYYLTYEFLG
ncbi:MAG TPA: NlpC/P60 family protein [Baekduia sp.]|nr:NlpC/P60 family protein [Baekduia sp.]